MFYFLLSITLLMYSCCAWSSVDLEQYCQDFVLETKKIDIPGHRYAFNPSIIRWNDQLLLSFRIIANPNVPGKISSSSTESKVGLVWLDDDFNAVSDPQILEWDEAFFPEDGRLISINDRLFLIYSGSSPNLIGPHGFFVYVAELIHDGLEFQIIHNECLSTFSGAARNHREKNWVPFINNEQLHLAYQLSPHTIFTPILDGSGMCSTLSLTTPSVVWEWGELRGGTPALPLNNNTYLSFFHSSKVMQTVHSNDQAVPHYFMGAYTFSSHTPFNMLQISPEPIVGNNFYHGEKYAPYWHPVRVVFPCGMLMDDTYIWVTYGRQDHECWVVKMDKQGLLDSLIQVSTILHTEN
jgi:predicted GH43/DUF377 family glycosyl hydrolase